MVIVDIAISTCLLAVLIFYTSSTAIPSLARQFTCLDANTDHIDLRIFYTSNGYLILFTSI